MNHKYFLITFCCFLIGIAVGIVGDSNLNISSQNFVSRTTLDNNAPNKNICLSYGASALVIDHRNFITFNPFKIYTAQTSIQPGCVLRSNNWIILENKNLISTEKIKNCKRKMNTFGYIGKLENSPEISCIYESNSALNSFLEHDFKNEYF
uniref:DUF3172-containing protein n=1 Tax=Sciadococcus taiwanensis TaxID=3028030 RepID=A0A9Y1I284_9RHOD|nr:DUF3172-containing protein [Sciadococcus taiwanensis]